jgi:hypothetical protein
MTPRPYGSSALAAAVLLAAAGYLTASLGEHTHTLEARPVQTAALTARLLPSAADRGPRRGCLVALTPMAPGLTQVSPPIPPRPGAKRACVGL